MLCLVLVTSLWFEPPINVVRGPNTRDEIGASL
jgi:hypothetical protein